MPTLKDLQELEELVALQERAEKVKPPEPSLWEQAKEAAGTVGHAIGAGATSLAKGLASNVVGALDVMGSQYDFGDALRAQQGLKVAKTQPGEIADKVQALGVLPRNKFEQYADSGLQGVGGALAGPGAVMAPGKAVLTGLMGGLGAQAAGDMPGVKGTAYEMPARFAGGIIGGAGPAALGTFKKNTGDVARDMLHGLTEKEQQEGIRAMMRAEANGVPINFSQGLKVPSNVDNLVEALVRQKEGSPLVAQLKAQPAKARALADKLLNKIPGQVRGKQIIADDAELIADKAITEARKQRSDQVRPLYEASGNIPEGLLPQLKGMITAKMADTGSPNKAGLYKSLLGDIEDLEKGYKPQPTGLLDAAGQEITIPGKPMPMTRLNDVLKDNNTNAKNINFSSAAGDKDAIGGLQTLVKEMRDTMGSKSPKFAEANQLYQDLTTQMVDPLRKSVVGDVAGRMGARPDISAVDKITPVLAAGRSPKIPAQDSQILQFARETKANPEVFSSAVKSHINNMIDQADTQVAGRSTADFASHLEKSLLGTAAQRQGMKDMLNGIEQNSTVPMKPNSLYRGLLSGMQVLSSVAKQPGTTGLQPSVFNRTAGASKVATTAKATSFNMGPMAGGAVSRWLSSDAYRKIAEALTTADGVRNLQRLSELPVMSPRAIAIVNTMLGAGAASNVPGLQNSNEGMKQEEEK